MRSDPGVGADIEVRDAASSDAGAMALIYNFYIKDTIVTFEEEPVSPGRMKSRLQDVRAAALPWLVAERAGEIVGYACATRWKDRHGYRFSAEVSVYLHPGQGGRGIGSMLYRRLLPVLQSGGVHAAIGGIALPNDASVALHEKFGFERVAWFKEVGFKFDQWIDVAYWEKVFSPPPAVGQSTGGNV
ncbi:MAG: N-acetyltransferase family protein [Acidobacteriota bacterium]